MHEVSVAESLLKIAVDECRRNGYSKISNVRVVIGKASGVMPEALLFAFDALKTETIAAGAKLTIEEVPVAGHCTACSADFTTSESFVLCCPRCGCGSYTLHAGRELDIKELEVD
ncbi:MAG: hydrogenase maturation nickel metallochaperone HypA [Dissulfurispiraceae bacterium]|jgi:hydrogenase nickel incorporation protein HypA/HybF